MDDTTIIIPVYQPGDRLEPLVRELSDADTRILVIDDGSTEGTGVFSRLADIRGVAVLRHAVNRGKGAALKTAFAAVLADPQDTAAVVTADGDGQHLAEDIFAVAAAAKANPCAVTLGVRTFSGKIPFRSRLGNLWTETEFRLLTGRRIADTQTGLRGIPIGLLPRFAALKGERYEYESRMLVAAALLPSPPVEIPISTIYLDGNATSHFRPLRDTLLTQSALIGETWSRRTGPRSPDGSSGSSPL